MLILRCEGEERVAEAGAGAGAECGRVWLM